MTRTNSGDEQYKNVDWIARDSDGKVQRRTIVQGAAWTIPVVAVAVAAPLAAASVQPCPTLAPVSDWVYDTPGGLIGSGATNTNNQLVFTAEAASTDAYEFFDTTFDAVAGETYTFSYQAFGSLGDQTRTTSQRIAARVSFNGTQAGPTIGTVTPEYGEEQISMDPNAPSTHTVTWTATTSGPVVLRFLFIINARDAGKTHNDNLVVRNPMLTC